MVKEGKAALYESPFQYAKEHVHPMRQRNRREASPPHTGGGMSEPRQGMWQEPSMRTAPVHRDANGSSKHRLLRYGLTFEICPDQRS